MRKCNITVFDYSDATHNSNARHYDKDNPPEVVEYNVEAYCVGGIDGIRAYFFKGDRFYEANGDDGHWWLMSVCGTGWLKEIIEALQAVEKKRKRIGAG